jgi:hypothetical protein
LKKVFIRNVIIGPVERKVPESVKKLYLLGLRHKKAIIIAFAILVLAIFFTSQIRTVVAIGLLAAAGAFGQVYRRSIRIPPAIELVTFGTVIVGYSYGPWAGAIFGIIVTFAAEIMSSSIDAFVIGYVPARAVIGVISSYLTGYGIFAVGIWMTILYNILAQPLYLIQPDAELRLKLIFFVTGNIIFNILIFQFLGAAVIMLIG